MPRGDCIRLASVGGKPTSHRRIANAASEITSTARYSRLQSIAPNATPVNDRCPAPVHRMASAPAVVVTIRPPRLNRSIRAFLEFQVSRPSDARRPCAPCRRVCPAESCPDSVGLLLRSHRSNVCPLRHQRRIDCCSLANNETRWEHWRATMGVLNRNWGRIAACTVDLRRALLVGAAVACSEEAINR